MKTGMFKIIVLVLAMRAQLGFALSQESFNVERRIQNTLSTYLEPTEFLVIVKELEPKKSYVPEQASALPGTPGLVTGDDGAKYKGYFDLDGKLQNAKARPPIEVEIVLNRNVSNETRNLVRRLVPVIAGMDTQYGDSLQIRNGNLESPSRRKWEAEEKSNWIESLVRHKREVGSLFFGLLAALAILMLINGVLGILRAKQKGSSDTSSGSNSKGKSEAAPIIQQAPSPLMSAPSGTQPAKEDAAKEKQNRPSREELYSKDSAFFEMVEEIRTQADHHPDRIGELLKRWIQEGDVGVRNAAILLRNFKFPIVEKIMNRMVASDLDCLRGYMDLDFDPFSEQNARVILQSRQELMKIVASHSSQYQVRGMDFLANLESHVLAELLRDEPIRSLVVASVAIPSNRLAEVLRTVPVVKQHEYFVSLVKMDRAEPGEVEKLQKHLMKKLEGLNQLLLTEDQKAESIVQLLKNVHEEKKKVELLNSIATQSRLIYERVRAKVTLFEDVAELPDRALKILILEEDPVLVARAFSRSSPEHQRRAADALPKAGQEIYEYEMAAAANISDDQYIKACESLVKKLETLVFEKIISNYDLKRETKVKPVATVKAPVKPKKAA